MGGDYFSFEFFRWVWAIALVAVIVLWLWTKYDFWRSKSDKDNSDFNSDHINSKGESDGKK